MFSSLRLRLLLTFAVVVAVAVGTVAVLVSRSTTNEFRRSVRLILDYPSYSLTTKIDAINKYLLLHNGERDLWQGLQRQLERMGQTSNARLIMANLDGNVRADSSGEYLGRQIDIDRSRPFAVFLIEHEPILAYVVPLENNSLETIERNFSGNVNRSLGWAIATAGLAALLLTVLLSQSILGPIEALIRATRRMEQGDLSQRVRLRTSGELQELGEAFNAMANGLQRLEQLRRNMVTDVAHELRTPLSNLRGYLEAIRDGVVEATPGMIASLHEEAMLLNRLVDDLQELALAESGQLTLVRQPVQLAELVSRSIFLLEARAAQKGLSLRADLPGDLPVVQADPERISQVLRNLLNNAITNTPPSGEVRLGARQVNGQVEVSVADSGMGIAPEHLPYVFERFYRVDKSRTRATGGAGLGLAIVKQLVEAHGGQVSIASEPERGTTVRFTLNC
jgi:signal transduction histidine kinase